MNAVLGELTTPQNYCIPEQSGRHFYSIQQILRCEAFSNYTRFYFIDGKKRISCKTLKQHDKKLVKKGFIRIHNSHLVNANYVVSFSYKGYLTLQDGTELPVARRRKKEVFHSLRLINKF